MAFEVNLSPSAKMDLEETFEYYNQASWSTAKKFYSEFINLHALLQQNPFFEIKYDVVRTCKLKSFPYVIHFIINEEQTNVTIIGIVFGGQKKINFMGGLPIV